MKRTIAAAVLLLPVFVAYARAQPSVVALPVVYDADRFFVVPKTADGKTLKLFVDTGGGFGLFEDAAEKLGLAVHQSTPLLIGQNLWVDLPDFRTADGKPFPRLSRLRMPVWEETDAAEFHEFTEGDLGSPWLAGGTWIFDYPARTLSFVDGPPQAAGTAVPLGFKEIRGVRLNNFPRIPITVDGETLDMELDTGGTSDFTPEALRAMGGGPSDRGSSFIMRWKLDDWRRRHPDWRIVEEANVRTHSAPAILVPEVKIAGIVVKDIWFSERNGPWFRESEKYMDRKIAGTVGGNILRNFRVTIDYPHAVAYFERPRRRRNALR